MGDAKAEKAGRLSILDKLVLEKFKAWAVPKVPLWLETYHLTLLTVAWSLGIIACGWLAYKYSNLNWFWLSSFFIFMQWVTDVLDGSVGRERNTGLIRWGFFMDHFLDYILLCSILISYSFTLPSNYINYSLFTLMIIGAFMVNSYLYFGAVGKFKINYYGFGPTEVRAAFIIFNAIVIFATPAQLAPFFPWALGAAIAGLIFVVYNEQRDIWEMDMKEKKKGKKNNS